MCPKIDPTNSCVPDVALQEVERYELISPVQLLDNVARRIGRDVVRGSFIPSASISSNKIKTCWFLSHYATIFPISCRMV